MTEKRSAKTYTTCRMYKTILGNDNKRRPIITDFAYLYPDRSSGE